MHFQWGSPPATEDQALARRVLEVIPLIMRHFRKDMRRINDQVDPVQFQILGMLAYHECSVSELAGKHKVSLPSMSKTVNSLVERGWVERIPLPGDRRVVRLKLTEEGTRLTRQIGDSMVESVSEVVGRLSPQEYDKLSNGLDVLYSAFGAFGPHGATDEIRPAHDDASPAATPVPSLRAPDRQANPAK